MSQDFVFLPAQLERMRGCFSAEFCESLPRNLAYLCEKWRLSGIEMIEYYSVNSLYLCKSPHYGACVLKVCDIREHELTSEWHTLREYGGGRFVRAYEVDFERSALLIERVIPGRQLSEIEDLDARLRAFADVVRSLNIAPKNPAHFREYKDVILGMPRLLGAMPAPEALRECVTRACLELTQMLPDYPRKMLLHGDLHFENILSHEGGGWKIIDPHGFSGDPVFELSRQLSNEFWRLGGMKNRADRAARMLYIIHFFERALGYPAQTLKRCFLIDAALTNFWNAESGEPVDEEHLRVALDLLGDE